MNASPPAPSRTLARALAAATCLVVVAACASGASGPATPGGAPSAIVVGSPEAASQCAAISTCGDCAAAPACRFCTEPRGCVAAGATCGGLLLADAGTCVNDPATGGSQRSRGLTMIHASVLAQLRDMTPAGPAIDARLEKLTSITFPIPAGRCYSLTWSIHEDARLAEATAQLDFTGPKGAQGSMIIDLMPSGWSGRACTSVPGTLTLTVVDSETYSHLVPAGTGTISFVLYSRPRTATDTDEGGGPPIVAPDAPDRAPRRAAVVPGTSIGPGVSLAGRSGSTVRTARSLASRPRAIASGVASSTSVKKAPAGSASAPASR